MNSRKDFRPKVLENNEDSEIIWKHIESDCKKIGIIGNYATGKTSIIKTLKHKHNDELELITLSSAIFNDDKELEYSTNYIELAMIRQLQVILDGSTYISNNLKIRKKIDYKTLKLSIFLMGVFIMIVLNFYFMKKFDILLLSSWHVLLNFAFVCLIIVLGMLLFKIVETYEIRKIDKDGLTLEKYNNIEKILHDNKCVEERIQKGNTDESVEVSIQQHSINDMEYKIISELIIEAYESLCRDEKYLVISIEDLDRHTNTYIFNYLYRLCQLFQNSNKKIVFIFSLQTGTIKGEETKYFDAIIDVIPHYDVIAAADKICNELSDLGYKVKFQHINNLATFIKDYRNALRVINKFQTYYQNTSIIEGLNQDTLFAISLINIIFPDELEIVSKNGEYNESDTQKLLYHITEEMLMANEDLFLEPGFVSAFRRIKENNDFTVSPSLETDIWYKISVEKPELKKLLDYCIESNLLDNNYANIISPLQNNQFATEDIKFINNYNYGNGVLENGETQLTNIQEIYDRYIIQGLLRIRPEFINDSLMIYLFENNKRKEISELVTLYIENNYFKNIIKNQQLNLFDNVSFLEMLGYGSKNALILEIAKLDEAEKAKLFYGKIRNNILDYIIDLKPANSTKLIKELKSTVTYIIQEYLKNISATNVQDDIRLFKLAILYRVEIELLKCHDEWMKKSQIVINEDRITVEETELELDEPIKIKFEVEAIYLFLKGNRIQKSIIFEQLLNDEEHMLNNKQLENRDKRSFIEYLRSKEDINVLQVYKENILKPYDFKLEDLKLFSEKEIVEIFQNEYISADPSDIYEIFDYEDEEGNELYYELFMENVTLRTFQTLLNYEGFDYDKDYFEVSYILENKLVFREDEEHIKYIKEKRNTLNIDEIDEDYEVLTPDNIKLFKFDLKAFIELISENEEVAMKYLENMEAEYTTEYNFEDPLVFQRICELDVEAQHIEKIVELYTPSQPAEILNIKDITTSVLNKLCSLVKVGKYRVDYKQLAPIISDKSSNMDEIKSIVDRAATLVYKNTNVNCIISDCLKISNTDVLEYVMKKINNQFPNFEKYVDFVYENQEEYVSLYDTLVNGPYEERFKFIKDVCDGVENTAYKTIPKHIIESSKAMHLLHLISEGKFRITKKSITNKDV